MLRIVTRRYWRKKWEMCQFGIPMSGWTSDVSAQSKSARHRAIHVHPILALKLYPHASELQHEHDQQQ